ncbi:hypothetical protein O6H91_18G082000 [Diphasiastrum complanatum]|uniref:Uncharacterized protein n=2 Tax=Diphasiastrum complanatum TaxID=34168 RepID=A0ACC2B4B6_DIPCM|nr:hypothetical protein O6H91_18G081700 [Diphasiastrum complanatum]KAJ7524199.1 hypothetical protein O6H91_18G082000 [Diphasiastrum complanatum]
MGSQVSTIKAAAGKLGTDSKKKGGKGDKAKIGILAFEVANLMSKSIQLWQSLSDQEILHLRTEVIKAEGVLKLVSDNEAVLLAFACREKLQDLTALARSVARLGKRCQDPALQGFEHVYNDVLKNNIDVSTLEYPLKEMEAKMKKMERYIASTSNLYQELEILADVEQAARRIQDDDNSAHREAQSILEQKIMWQRQEVKYLRDISLWNRTFDKIVALLARTVCTIHRRIAGIFGSPMLGLNHLVPLYSSRDCDQYLSSQFNYSNSSQILFLSPQSAFFEESNDTSTNEIHGDNFSSHVLRLPCRGIEGSDYAAEVCSPSPPKSSITSTASMDCDSHPERHSRLSPVSCFRRTRSSHPHLYPPRDGLCSLQSRSSFSRSGFAQGPHSIAFEKYEASLMDPGFSKGCLSPTNLSQKNVQLNRQESYHVYQSQCIDPVLLDPLCSHQKAPTSTLGGAALALHYANIIIVLEKMVRFPQLIGSDARDDLYRMLPKSVRIALRSRIRFFPRDSTRFDAAIAEHWKEILADILRWLAPLAHNMIRWQSEHNFEQQVVSRTNVLLLQTLHFADRVKAESAITELLVGLNYICGHEKESKSSQLDFVASNNDLEEYLDWQF